MIKKLPNFKLTAVAQAVDTICRYYWRKAWLKQITAAQTLGDVFEARRTYPD